MPTRDKLEPRNIITNKTYRNTYYRAYGKAIRRLITENQCRFDELLEEERERAGLPYRREKKPC